MGQPVTVLRTQSSRPGLVRFELNRSLTGMGHERYVAGEEIAGDRPADELARRIFAAGDVEWVHIYSSVVTVQLGTTDELGLTEVIEGLYTYYLPGVEIPSDEELIAMVE